MNPREKRLLKCLIEKDKVFVRDLRSAIGALNPAQCALNLRRHGWKIQTGYTTVLDRDGRVCKPGYYWIDLIEKEKAQKILKETERAGGAAPPEDNNFESGNSTSSELDNSKGGENDKPSI